MKTLLLSITLIFLANYSALPQTANRLDWARGIVWYQIFPERFANSDKNNEPEAHKVFINSKIKPENWSVTPWTSNWYAQSVWEKELGGNFNDHLYSRRYGGDIQGIIDNLDYLKELGIEGLYLNPIFEAVSLHKYDGSTFHHIDVNFGPDPDGDRKLISSEIPDNPQTWVWTKADLLFLKLIEEVHSRKMFIVIDGVLNHTGTQFWAFQDITKKGEKSLYKDWYQIKSFDDKNTPQNEFDYKGWWNIPSLPEFNRTKENLVSGVKEYIFNATLRWMTPTLNKKNIKGIDGWRLDVARDVPLGFWKEWSTVVRKANPNAIIIGELWELSPDFVYENGPFDALMNYNFAYPAFNLFVDKTNKTTVSAFIDSLKKIDKNYPKYNLDLLQNLLGSHDTERFSSMIVNPDRKYDRDGHSGNAAYNPGKPTPDNYKTLKQLVAFQMTYKGAPMIYYGDEVGMWGPDDPHCRKPMIWSYLKYDDEVIDENSNFKVGLGQYSVEQNKDILDFYKKMISIRKNNKSLKYGDVEFSDDKNNPDLLIYKRTYKEERTLVLFNLGNKVHTYNIESKTNDYIDLFSSEKLSTNNNKISIKIEPGYFRIIKY